MDSNVIIAVVSIVGVIVGIVGTYFVQKTTLATQRKWALEDDSRRIKREILSKRLDIIVEAIGIVINEIGRAVAIEMGNPRRDDEDATKEQRIRLQSIRAEAWVAAVALGSKELTQYWTSIHNVYSGMTKTGIVGQDAWAEAQKSYAELIKLTDTMRSQV